MQVAADFGVGGVVGEFADGAGHVLASLNPHPSTALRAGFLARRRKWGARIFSLPAFFRAELLTASRRPLRFEFRCPGGPSGVAVRDLRVRIGGLLRTSSNGAGHSAIRGRGRGGRGRSLWSRRWS